MWKRLLIIAVAVGLFFLKNAWRDHQRQQRFGEELQKQNSALNSMSERLIVNSEWDYSGPLGELTLHFEPKGKLTVDVDGKTKTGRWEVVAGYSLNVLFPDSDKMQSALFRTSTDELVALRLDWTAKRVW